MEVTVFLLMGGSEKSYVEDEMAVITGILSDLEKKVNRLDLVHVINSIMIFNLLLNECRCFFLVTMSNEISELF
jgi:hypothetical protein